MKKIVIFLLLILPVLSIQAQNKRTVRVMHYNILSFGPSCQGSSLVDRYGFLGEILDEVRPDILTVNEIGDELAFSSNITQVAFDYNTSMAYGDESLKEHTSSIVNQIFYNTALFTYAGEDIITGHVRDINVYTLYVNATANVAGSDTVFLHCIVAHLKASTGTANVNQRSAAAQDIMAWVDQNGKANANVLLLGDMNVYSSGEAAFQEFVANANPDIRFDDPGNWQNGWGGASNSLAHTQSTRLSSPDCGSGGGMDDRFDMILASSAIMDGSAQVNFVPGSYKALGNNGSSYNQELTCAGNTTVSTAVCLALRKMSDHLPVVLDLEIPAVPTALGPTLIPGLQARVLHQDRQQWLQLSGQGREDLVLSLLSLTGQVVYRQPLAAGNLGRKILLPQQTPGMYLLRLTDSQGRHIWQKIRM